MNEKTLAKTVRKCYACYGVQIKLKYLDFIPDTERYIYKVKLLPGTKGSDIFTRAVDVQTALELPLFQPYKDGLHLYLAISCKAIQKNSLAAMLNSQAFRHSKAALPVALGYDMFGRMVIENLAKMPHAMYAGSTNSGKSVGLQALILSLTYRLPANKVNLILFDVGANSMDVFTELPHLSHPIIKDTHTGVSVIIALDAELERRINLTSAELKKLPALICIIDEYISFISNLKNNKESQEITDAINNLLRRGRHAKIHIVLATQDPTKKDLKVDVENITARIAFRCATYQNSIAILNAVGAEKLAGQGDMLYRSMEHRTPLHLQGAFMTTDEIELYVAKISSANHGDLSNKFVIPELEEIEPEQATLIAEDDTTLTKDKERSIEFARILLWVLSQSQVSAEKIKNKFGMGNRVKPIMEKLTDMGLVTEQNGNQSRTVLPLSIEDVPAAVLSLLSETGISEDEVAVILKKKFEI